MIENGKNYSKLSIAAYCRISVDDELGKENTSIENQKAIISEYVELFFPNATVDYYEDRDRSGYTFEQRENYQVMRVKLFSGRYDILIVKDLSRFSRRNSRGLVEIEDLRDVGIRIIAIGDNIDYPTNDDWFRIQFYFLMNEMPVTDTSKKVRNVIQRMQKLGQWVCSVPYGYVITDTKKMIYEVDPKQAVVVQRIFKLYNEGWGYKRIANHLTDMLIPTPRMDDIARKEAKGETCKYKYKTTWSIVTVQGILSNDFYIGTLRQRKYTRDKINGADEKVADENQYIFENHHEPIIERKVFEKTKQIMKNRSRNSYMGIKKYTNAYSGRIFCGDCGHAMYSLSRSDLREAYHCGTYANRGLKGCTSHHIYIDTLDQVVKEVLMRIRENSLNMVLQLEKSMLEEEEGKVTTKSALDNLQKMISDTTSEKKSLIRERALFLANSSVDDPDTKKIYDELIDNANTRLSALTSKAKLLYGDNAAFKALNSVTFGTTTLDRILNKTRLQKDDICPIVKKIIVYEDYVHVQLVTDFK